jgi:hypothetical protein
VSRLVIPRGCTKLFLRSGQGYAFITPTPQVQFQALELLVGRYVTRRYWGNPQDARMAEKKGGCQSTGCAALGRVTRWGHSSGHSRDKRSGRHPEQPQSAATNGGYFVCPSNARFQPTIASSTGCEDSLHVHRDKVCLAHNDRGMRGRHYFFRGL